MKPGSIGDDRTPPPVMPTKAGIHDFLSENNCQMAFTGTRPTIKVATERTMAMMKKTPHPGTLLREDVFAPLGLSVTAAAPASALIWRSGLRLPA